MTKPQHDIDNSLHISRIVEDLARRRAAGERIDDDSVISAHRHLMPGLKEQLEALRMVEEARRRAKTGMSSAPDTSDREGPNHHGTVPFPSDSFPGCDIVEEIHRGGQGVVYRAVHRATSRDVAIKILRGGPFQGPHDRARFDREIRILAQLKHPNIVTIHDSGMAAGSHYFVMDYIPGQPLDIYMAARKQTVREILELFKSICTAVNAAHLRGIIHRDLKPGNILIDERGEPQILDFGLAKMAEDQIAGSTSGRAMTMTGQFVGSLPWASPEQAAGSPDQIDLRTDVYALGLIVYHMLTGRFPYDVTGKFREVLTNTLETAPIAPSTIRKDVDGDVETIVLKCLAKEPRHRYQSAGAVAEDVERYLTSQPILARAPSTMYQLRKLAVRHKVSFALTATVFLLICGFGIWMSVLYGRADVSLERALHAERQAATEAETARVINDFLVNDLLAAAQPEVAQGNNVTVEQVLESASRRIEGAFPDQPLIEGAIRVAIAESYMSLGRYFAAERHFRAAESIRTRELGSEAPDTLRVRRRLAGALEGQGKYAEAYELAGATMELMPRVFGEEHEETLAAAHQFAELNWSIGRISDSKALMRKTMETRRRVLGEDHPDTLASLIAWGSTALMSRKETVQAEEMFREAYEACTRVLGAGHPQTLRAMGLVAAALTSQRRFDEADELFSTALEGHRRILGDEHPDTLKLKWSLAKLRQGQDRIEEAITLFREVNETGQRILGAEHPQTVEALDSLGHMLALKGRYGESATIHRRALEVWLRLFGRDSSQASSSLDSLGMALYLLGRYAEAESCHRESYDILQRLEPGVPSAVDPLRGLVRALAAQGRGEVARPFAEELLGLRREAANGADTDAYLLNCYARVLLTVEPADLRDPKQALEFAQKAFERSTDAYHYNRYTLALAYEANDDLAGATAMAKRALEHIPLEVSEEHVDYERALVRFLEKSGDDDAAEKVYRDTLTKRRERYTDGHLDIAESLARLGETLVRHGRHAEAESILRECLEVRSDVLPEDHWLVGEAMSLLGTSISGQGRPDDAEPFLVDGYRIIVESPMARSLQAKSSLRRIEHFFQASGEPDRAVEFQAMFPTDSPPPDQHGP